MALKGLFKLPKKQLSYLMGGFLIIIASFIIINIAGKIYTAIRDFNPKEAIFSLGADLKKDEYGYTNILLLGDGGHERDGADLIDTIMVASIDFDRKTVGILSIPRDYYVRSTKHKSSKINEWYRNNKNKGEEEAYQIFQEVAGEVAGLNIQYYLRVDFNAFVEVIDSLGGITVDVRESIHDPYYPNETDNGYTIFKISAGLQEIDGETALKFVRSRKTTSDFDRAARQQQVILAIKEKGLSGKTLTNPKTIKKLYESVKNNINTNLSIGEMIAMASFGRNLDTEGVIAKVLHDDPGQEGGFLYTPERQYYNGQFVLVPDGNNLDLIHRYADLIFHHKEVFMNPVNIEILNGTKKAGIAGSVASFLKRFGFKVINIDNFLDGSGKKKAIEKSFIQYNYWEASASGAVKARDIATLTALEKFIKAEAIPSHDPATEGNPIDISIVLGEDHEIYWKANESG